jgi:hypothetical protein
MSLIIATKTYFSSEILFFRELCIPFGLDSDNNLTFLNPLTLDGQFLCRGKQWFLQQLNSANTPTDQVYLDTSQKNIIQGSGYQLKVLANTTRYELGALIQQPAKDLLIDSSYWSDFCLEVQVGKLRKTYGIPNHQWLTVWYKNCDILIPNLTTKLMPFKIKFSDSTCYIKDYQENLYLNGITLRNWTPYILKRKNQLYIPSGKLELSIRLSASA